MISSYICSIYSSICNISVPESARPLPLLMMNPYIWFFGRLTSNKKVPSEQTWRIRPTERTEQGRPTSSILRHRCRNLRDRQKLWLAVTFLSPDDWLIWVSLEKTIIKSETGVLLFSCWSVVSRTILLLLLLPPKTLNWWWLPQLQKGRPLQDRWESCMSEKKKKKKADLCWKDRFSVGCKRTGQKRIRRRKPTSAGQTVKHTGQRPRRKTNKTLWCPRLRLQGTWCNQLSSLPTTLWQLAPAD